VSRLAVRFTDANPTSTHGVPPMRSRVEKANPFSFPFSVAQVMSTHASACFDSNPTS
jgi:hypothetical protein